MSVLYDHGKANVVADALSWLSMGSVAHIEVCKKQLFDMFIDLHDWVFS